MSIRNPDTASSVRRVPQGRRAESTFQPSDSPTPQGPTSPERCRRCAKRTRLNPIGRKLAEEPPRRGQMPGARTAASRRAVRSESAPRPTIGQRRGPLPSSPPAAPRSSPMGPGGPRWENSYPTLVTALHPPVGSDSNWRIAGGKPARGPPRASRHTPVRECACNWRSDRP